MTKSKFDIAYNKWLQQVDVDEGDSLWNALEDELDFMETWDHISAKLDETKPQKGRLLPMRFLKRMAAVAAILLLLFFPVRYLLKQPEQPNMAKEQGQEVSEKKMGTSQEVGPVASKLGEADAEEGLEGLEVAQVTIAGIPVEADALSIDAYSEVPSPRLSADFILKSEDGAIEDSVIRLERLALEGLQSPSFNVKRLLISQDDMILPHLTETDYSYFTSSEKSPELSVSSSSLRIVDAGLVYGYKNTWLLNYETRNGLNPSKLGSVQPTFRQDMGIASTFELFRRHLVGLEFFWKAESGQDYQQYVNARFVDKNIQLDYLKLQTFYCYENKMLPGQILLGGYAARLTMAEEQIAESSFGVNDRYNDFDYGLLAGYQVHVPIAKRIVFKPSIRFNYNLVNMFEGDEMIPGNLKDTRNLAASFNFSLSYKFDL
ncbi:hypothetical protein [Geofilum rubicundum]|uniref:Outer membrane protein beta-barrel domain-containing protein n=1 Tax=Geofilum rubicundum JCM 15548 TaxID=1236989 RepID=A0A0E9LX21_9BACT|nr:hypothetical protein [Geofilum rubicundum]GAO29400.1 hypothetical protein JCM15548_11581 [Geofilum rubicundum JCM 15548]